MSLCECVRACVYVRVCECVRVCASVCVVMAAVLPHFLPCVNVFGLYPFLTRTLHYVAQYQLKYTFSLTCLQLPWLVLRMEISGPQ